MSKKKRTNSMHRNASKAPTWLRTIAAAKFDPIAERKHREAQLGTFGAASEVRHIDPSEYEGLNKKLPAVREQVA